MPDHGLSAQSMEAELVSRSIQGDPRSFQELTLRFYRPLCAFILKKVQQPDLVEDLVQETFLEAYRALKNGTVPGQFSSWLFGIAVNRCGKWFRRKRPVLFPATEPPDLAASVPFVSPQEELEEQTRRLTRLETCLAALPAEIRTLLDLKHRQGKTCERIALELNQPVGTIKSQLSRAYKALRACLSAMGEENP
jgi:RNA polymerase sigma-70 factor (ECF subfamily)